MTIRFAGSKATLKTLTWLFVLGACHTAATPALAQAERAYVVDARGLPTLSGSGLCWRTGFWSPSAAAATDGQTAPLGCRCEADVLPAAACEPPAAAPEPMAPIALTPAPGSQAAIPATAAAPQKVKLSAEANFDFNTSVLDDASKARLDELAAALRNMTLEVILAVGHADRIGPEAYNQTISEKRAAEVKSYLIDQGVPASRIYTEGQGEKQPAHIGDCDGLGSENRRNIRLIECLRTDRRVEIEAIGVR